MLCVRHAIVIAITKLTLRLRLKRSRRICQHKNKTVNGNTEVNENCTEAGCPSIAQLNKVELSLTPLHLTLKHDIEPNSKYGSLDPEN